MKKQIVRILNNLERLYKIRDEFEEMFEEISEHCPYYVPSKDSTIDYLRGCIHKLGTICCVNECPLNKDMKGD